MVLFRNIVGSRGAGRLLAWKKGLAPLHTHRASFSSDASSKGDRLYRGAKSTQYSSVQEFKRGFDGFNVYQQMDASGNLYGTSTLPFSLDEGVRMYELMVKSSVYDDVLNTMQRQGRISFYCTNYGEEAASVGTAAALMPEDTIWPQYRELGMFLWRGLTPQEIVDQNIGNEGDKSKGRNLQVHYAMLEKNVQTVHAVLGTQIPQAPGAGYAYKLEKANRVSVTYFGDGAASEGDALTALNFAAVYGSQTIFICRNNGYSISTGVEDQYAGDGIGARSLAFDIPTIRVDGNDLVAVYKATAEARKICVGEQTPVLIELMTYRVGDHTTSDDSSAYRKETKEEFADYKAKMPIPRWRTYLEAQGAWDATKEAAIREEAKTEIMAAFKAGEAKKKPPLRDLFTDTYSDLTWNLEEQAAYIERHCREYASDYNLDRYRGLDGPAPAVQPASIASGPRKLPPAPKGPEHRTTMVNAINDALSIALASDPKTILYGEDVAFGGVFRCSVGLREKHGDGRVLNAPVAEQAIAGFAVGLGVAGYKAIAEMQFADYIFPAFDQIVNEIAKYRYRCGSTACGNITIRSPCSAVGHGSMYHSQSPESYFAHCPGLKVVIPRGPRQAKGLLLAAIREPNPVLFFEPKILYRAPFDGPDGLVPEGDYELPLGQAEVVRKGTDITLVGWGSQIGRLEAAADRAAADGISCEIIDLQTITPWDVDAVEASVKRTGRLLVAHEAPVTNGFGAEIATKIQERCFLHLEAPISRVCGYDTHFPYAWEEFYVPSAARVHEAIKATVGF
eukprot:gnl/TRDRNA2_/TRDRNA2_195925_c0_seq1.p1 gnl/TRDRNA2_/TRDRNA2_195925_c0~~gnl/TRDRNA2_/TRDRNA2_195925_c0_seq1.p1  ORF type:complete len:790 (-),score=115.86 gnl/TRDRNA2_/TRDRNA2_195925_c0_seq1:103-2472(-)